MAALVLFLFLWRLGADRGGCCRWCAGWCAAAWVVGAGGMYDHGWRLLRCNGITQQRSRVRFFIE